MLSWNKGEDIIRAIQPFLDDDLQGFAQRALSDNPSKHHYTGENEIGALSRELANLDAEKLKRFSLSLPVGNDEVARKFVSGYLLTQGDDRNRLTTAILNSRAHELPTNLAGHAVDYALTETSFQESIESGLEFRLIRAAAHHATTLLDRDPAVATCWVEDLPQGPTRDQTLKNLPLKLRNLDPTAAEAWLGQLPAEEAAAVRQFFKVVSKHQ